MSKAAELAALIGSQTALSNRNLIINSAMQVAQRGTQTNQTTAYTACDRFQFGVVGAAVITSSQDTTVPSGQGFSNSLKLDVTTADSSLAASDFAFLRHKIEAQNLQHLNYGTSSAKSLTLSFWVRSSKTGTHIAELRHDDATYFNSQAYTISSADVWQKVTLTYDGYVTTAINNDNGAGINVNWWLAAGSDYSGGTLSSNNWQNTSANRAVGQVNVMDSTSNTFYITGVQLEVGETATPFEHESYDTTIQKCYRYYFKLFPAASQRNYLGTCYVKNSTQSRVVVTFPVPLRTVPTAIEETGTANDYATYVAGTETTCTAVPTYTSYGTANSQIAQFTSSGLTNGHAGDGRATDADGFLAWSAEL